MKLLGAPPPPLQVIRARPVLLLYTNAQNLTRWYRVSPIEVKWTPGDQDPERLDPGYIFRMFDHDKHKMISIVPERIKRWEQEK